MMSKHFGNLKRLHSKLITRYGAEDDLVIQISNELGLLKIIESKFKLPRNFPNARRAVTAPEREFLVYQ